ncbi:MAG: hypothetical protein JST78_09530 [Bacteroidetes bacterium]|nr:hypothetical protein [Bacteroidota bacterium]
MKSFGLLLYDNTDSGELLDLKIKAVRGTDGLITSGFVVGNVVRQNQALIIMASPGEFHFNPTIGVAIKDIILDDDYLRFQVRIREHLSKDGFKVKSVEFNAENGLMLDANYE